jgi:hypothetical protein
LPVEGYYRFYRLNAYDFCHGRHVNFIFVLYLQAILTIRNADGGESVPFTISDFDRALVTVGGWLEYADEKYQGLVLRVAGCVLLVAQG